MRARSTAAARRRRYASGLAGLAVLAASPAAAQTRATVDVGAGVSVATNPFLQSGDPDAGVAATAEVSPLLIHQEDRTTLTLRGTAQIRRYLNDYGTEDNYGLNAAGTHVVSDRLTLTAAAGVQSSRSALGAFQPAGLPFSPGLIGGVTGGTGTDTGTSVGTGAGATGGVVAPPLAGPIVTPGLLPDVTLAGRLVRTTTFDARGGLTYAPSPTDVIGLDVAARATRFNDDGLVDNDFLSAEARYSRRLSERTGIGAIVTATRTNFADGGIAGVGSGNASTLVPMFSVDHQLSERLTLSAAAGVSFTWYDTPDGSSESSTGFALRGNICNRVPRGSLCLEASRQPLPTALGDVRTANNLLVSYNGALDENDQLTFGGYYNSTSGSPIFEQDGVDLDGVNEDGIDLIGASASLAHRFGRRLSGVATLGYSDFLGGGFDVRPNFLASVGLRVTFGAVP